MSYYNFSIYHHPNQTPLLKKENIHTNKKLTIRSTVLKTRSTAYR